MQRRRYLAVAGAALVAGCGGSDGGSTPTDTETEEQDVTIEDTATATETATSTPTATPEPTLQVRIDYADDWGATLEVTADGGMQTRSLSDSGPETYDVDPTASLVSVTAEKEDSTARTLTVQLIRNGEVIAESSTNEGFGETTLTEQLS